MITLFNNSMRPKQIAFSKYRSHEEGMAIVIVLAASAIAALTTMAVVIRAYSNYTNGVKLSLADRAKEAAESGLSIFVRASIKITQNG